MYYLYKFPSPVKLQWYLRMALGWAWSVLWFFVLIFIAVPVAFIASFFFIILSPFSACCACMKVITDFLHKGVMLPYNVAVYMVAGKAGCWSLSSQESYYHYLTSAIQHVIVFFMIILHSRIHSHRTSRGVFKCQHFSIGFISIGIHCVCNAVHDM